MLLRKYSKSRANIMKQQKTNVPSNLKMLARKNTSASLLLPSLGKNGKIESMFPIIPQPIVDSDSQLEIPIILSDRHDFQSLSQNIPSLSDCPTSSIKNVIIRKFKLCKIQCCFSRKEKDNVIIDVKTRTLKELYDFITPKNHEYLIDQELYNNFNQMCFLNLCGSQLVPKHKLLVPIEEETMFVNPAIRHISLVFDMITRYISVFDNKCTLKKELVNLIVDLVGAPDVRERRMAAMVVTKLVSKDSEITPSILRKIVYNIYQFKIGTLEYFGIYCYMNILSTCYDSFFPIKKHLFKEVILYTISLANSPHLINYSKSLFFFFETVLKNNHKLAPFIVSNLIKRFPISSLTNQVIFISFINRIFNIYCSRIFTKIYLQIFKFYAMCANSESKRVVGESFVIWDNEEICKHIAVYAKKIYPIMYTAIKDLCKKQTIDDLSIPANAILKKMKLLNSSEYIRVEIGEEQNERLSRSRKWEIVQDTAEYNENMWNELFY